MLRVRPSIRPNTNAGLIPGVHGVYGVVIAIPSDGPGSSSGNARRGAQPGLLLFADAARIARVATCGSPRAVLAAAHIVLHSSLCGSCSTESVCWQRSAADPLIPRRRRVRPRWLRHRRCDALDPPSPRRCPASTSSPAGHLPLRLPSQDSFRRRWCHRSWPAGQPAERALALDS
jgi:hypothetical protein